MFYQPESNTKQDRTVFVRVMAMLREPAFSDLLVFCMWVVVCQRRSLPLYRIPSRGCKHHTCDVMLHVDNRCKKNLKRHKVRVMRSWPVIHTHKHVLTSPHLRLCTWSRRPKRSELDLPDPETLDPKRKHCSSPGTLQNTHKKSYGLLLSEKPILGALTIRIGFRGPLCCYYNKEPPK